MRGLSSLLPVLLALAIIVACSTTAPAPKDDNTYCGQNATLIDFGSVVIGDSKVMELVITANDIPDESNEISTTVTCEDKDFAITDYLGTATTGEQEIVLTAGEQATVYLRFEPQSEGPKSFILEIGSDCTDVELKGIGAEESGWSIDRIDAGPDLYDVWGDGYQTYSCGDLATVLEKTGNDGEWTAMEDTGIPDIPLRSVWGIGTDVVWFAGGITDYGITYARAFRYYEPVGAWTELMKGTMVDCYGSAWGPDDCDIYFGGGAIGGMMPNVSRWDCSILHEFIIGMEYDIVSGIFGSGPEDIWAVQANHFDSLYHYDGSGWEATKEPFMDKALFDVWVASGGEACAAGADGAIYIYNGSSWEDRSLEASTDTIFGVWGLSPDDIYAVGTNTNIWHWDGNTWTSEAVPGQAVGTLYSIWIGGSGEGYAVGEDGLILILRQEER